LGSMAFVALSGALVPRGMLIDLVYNVGVRHLFGGAPLPSTPKPRQFSYLISTVWLAGSATSFAYGLPLLGFLLGGGVVLGGTILTTTLWCLGSWFYRRGGLGDTRQWQRDRKDSAAAWSVAVDRNRSAADAGRHDEDDQQNERWQRRHGSPSRWTCAGRHDGTPRDKFANRI